MALLAAIILCIVLFAVILRGLTRHKVFRKRLEELCLRVQRLIEEDDLEVPDHDTTPQKHATDYLLKQLQYNVNVLKEHRHQPPIDWGIRTNSRQGLLTKLHLEVEILEMGLDIPRLPEGHRVCYECWQHFPKNDLVVFGDFHVCAGCKERFLQKLREGVDLGR